MANDYGIGRDAARRGYVAPPKAENWQATQQRNAGWDHEKNVIRPVPQPAPKDTKSR